MSVNLARTYRWAFSCLGSDGILASGGSAHTVRLWDQTVSAAKLCPVILVESCQLSSGQTVKLSPVAVKIRRLSAGTSDRGV